MGINNDNNQHPPFRLPAFLSREVSSNFTDLGVRRGLLTAGRHAITKRAHFVLTSAAGKGILLCKGVEAFFSCFIFTAKYIYHAGRFCVGPAFLQYSHRARDFITPDGFRGKKHIVNSTSRTKRSWLVYQMVLRII